MSLLAAVANSIEPKIPTVAVPTFTLFHSTAATASVQMKFAADGSYEGLEGASVAESGSWASPSSYRGLHLQIRATATDGVVEPEFASFSGAAFDSWLDLTSDRTWTLTAGSGGVAETTVLFEIRNKISGAVLSSNSINMNVEDTL